ncbi:hypothetical protein [Agrobacterium tumefaciens]|uniref:hypothetical protein n=1 Tax=Agrobacterium tumefaciens TaxID=358 RepID=UPI00224330B1|nr:hypothetical protein [Agrobacterium tumefaciens]MCW8061210.1 hypothetical protein [Agrobacterium tumefaciens]MCW8147422.1 hypothetical protein [Agrobacterium tumefaciens]
MGKITTLAERALAKAGSVLEKVDSDKAERLGEKIKKVFGEKAFGKIERFAEAADDERLYRRIQKEEDPALRAKMIDVAVYGSNRYFTRNDRSGRGL